MEIKMKPLFILGKEFSLIWQSDGSLEWISDERTLKQRISELSTQLRDNIESDVVLLKEAVVRSGSDLQDLRKEVIEADIDTFLSAIAQLNGEEIV